MKELRGRIGLRKGRQWPGSAGVGSAGVLGGGCRGSWTIPQLIVESAKHLRFDFPTLSVDEEASLRHP